MSLFYYPTTTNAYLISINTSMICLPGKLSRPKINNEFRLGLVANTLHAEIYITYLYITSLKKLHYLLNEPCFVLASLFVCTLKFSYITDNFLTMHIALFYVTSIPVRTPTLFYASCYFILLPSTNLPCNKLRF